MSSNDPQTTPRPDYECLCGRIQGGQIGEVIAVKLGWKHNQNGWECPFCSGNEYMLKAIFHDEEIDGKVGNA